MVIVQGTVGYSAFWIWENVLSFRIMTCIHENKVISYLKISVNQFCKCQFVCVNHVWLCLHLWNAVRSSRTVLSSGWWRVPENSPCHFPQIPLPPEHPLIKPFILQEITLLVKWRIIQYKENLSVLGSEPLLSTWNKICPLYPSCTFD